MWIGAQGVDAIKTLASIAQITCMEIFTRLTKTLSHPPALPIGHEQPKPLPKILRILGMGKTVFGVQVAHPTEIHGTRDAVFRNKNIFRPLTNRAEELKNRCRVWHTRIDMHITHRSNVTCYG